MFTTRFPPTTFETSFVLRTSNVRTIHSPHNSGLQMNYIKILLAHEIIHSYIVIIANRSNRVIYDVYY